MPTKENGWYCVVSGNEKRGPISRTDLLAMHSSGDINDATLVWVQGFSDWTTFGSHFKEFIPPPIPKLVASQPSAYSLDGMPANTASHDLHSRLQQRGIKPSSQTVGKSSTEKAIPSSNKESGKNTLFLKFYAVSAHVAVVIFASTLLNFFISVRAPNLLGVLGWLAQGVGMAIPAFALGLLGLLNKSNRVVGFFVVSWCVLALIAYGSFPPR